MGLVITVPLHIIQSSPSWPHNKQEQDVRTEMYKMTMYPKKWYDALWWRFMPGVTIKVKWPSDINSSDPNDHYRPYLEKNVGLQGWDWNWALKDNDIDKVLITIKFRKKHSKWATLAALQWS